MGLSGILKVNRRIVLPAAMAPVRSSNANLFIILMLVAAFLKWLLPEKLEFIAMGLAAIAVLILIAGIFQAFGDMFRK